MEELKKRLNSDEASTRLRKSGRNATYTLQIEREPENGIENALTVGFAVVNGKVTDVWTDKSKLTEMTDLVISGKYGVWVDMIHSRLSLTDAFFSKKLSLRGETD